MLLNYTLRQSRWESKIHTRAHTEDGASVAHPPLPQGWHQDFQ